MALFVWWRSHIGGWLVLASLLLLGGCAVRQPAGALPADGADGEIELLVFAAASLTDAFLEAAAAFEAANPGVTIVANFGGSSGLATQLLEGGEADVFASANEIQMQRVMEAGRVVEEPVVLASNRLVVIVPADNPAGVQSLADLAKPGVQLILAIPGVPVRTYTDQIVEKLAVDPAYGTAFAEGFYANLVSEENNVRQVANKVALGEADAGVVYTSDVTPDIADDVLQIEVPDAFNVVAAYPIAPLVDAPHPEQAQAFIDFLLSEQGQTVLQRWGFEPVPQE